MTPDPTGLLRRLDEKNATLVAQLRDSPFCRHFFAEERTTDELAGLVSSLLHEAHTYGGQLVRAIGIALGRLGGDPRWSQWISSLTECWLDEVTHPEMARQDAAKLGWVPEDSRPSPAAFAVGAVARTLCEEHHPLSHLGFFYLLEGTSGEIAQPMQALLKGRGVHSPFVDLHSQDDAAHADRLLRIITEIVGEDPAMAEEIEYGYHCFSAVYPLPLWDSALNRFLSQVELPDPGK